MEAVPELTGDQRTPVLEGTFPDSPPSASAPDVRAGVLRAAGAYALIACEPVRVTRLLADTCGICGNTGDVQVHHIRALADLAHAGWPASDWTRAMLDRRRKTVVACDTCHDRIHEAQTAGSFTL